ncbi:hypothetical protein [Streptomyces sp. A-14]|uniref:hypothetical protein n=1 Tax=Streptomyces sp. A-14 TaxID=3127467 RepID=UPI003EBCC3F1
MPRTAPDNGLPGISGLMAYHPGTAAPLGDLERPAADAVLAPTGERELITAYVPYLGRLATELPKDGEYDEHSARQTVANGCRAAMTQTG